MQMKTLIGACASIPLALGYASPASAKDTHNQELEQQLHEFHQNPKAFMNKKVKKHREIKHTKFKAHHEGKIQHHKYAHRAKYKRVHAHGKEAPAYNDQARNLVDKFQYEKLADMETNKLLSAKLAETPWSDDYWPIYAGGAAKRYADPAFGVSDNWKKNTDQIKNAWKKTLTQAGVDKLSPAEKYDLLIGDATHPLSTQQLNEGASYAKPDGSGVESWMGHCHGWAPAAFSVVRPKNTIVVKSGDGKLNIPFYPSDLRALSTILWANTNPTTKFIGGRCNTEKPPQDANGRITAAECRDVNPGTWHKAVVNQVGVAKRSMVLDVTFDYQVWNQPFYSYKYTYFNPLTNKAVATLAEAKAAKGFAGDKFAATRAANATSIVGISMDVAWVVETVPTHSPTNSAANDMTSGATWLYTLELDANGSIIGGEWMQNAHPDFLWTPPAGTHARATQETGAIVAAETHWDAKSPLPASLRASASAAAKGGDPLGAIIEALAARSALGR